jgi:hypothetical protein
LPFHKATHQIVAFSFARGEFEHLLQDFLQVVADVPFGNIIGRTRA